MAASTTQTPSHRHLAWSSRRIGLLFAALAVAAVIAAVAVGVAMRDPTPGTRCVPAEGASAGHSGTSGQTCSASTKSTGVGVLHPGAKPGAPGN